MLSGKGDCMSFWSKEFLSFYIFLVAFYEKFSRLKKEMQPRHPPLCPLVIPFVYISRSNGGRRVRCHCVTVGTYFKIHFNNVNSTCLYSFQLLYLRNECLFFSVHGKWIAVRNKQIAWTAKRFSCDLLVPHCDSFPTNREKKTLIPYIYNASNKDPF